MQASWCFLLSAGSKNIVAIVSPPICFFKIIKRAEYLLFFLLPVLQVAHWSVNQRSFPTDTPAVPLFLFRRRSNARSMFYVAARKWSLRPIDQGQLNLRAPINLSWLPPSFGKNAAVEEWPHWGCVLAQAKLDFEWYMFWGGNTFRFANIFSVYANVS